MQKNVASQKVALLAIDTSTNLPKTGDAANLTAYVSKDWGAVTVLADTSATEADATNSPGIYIFDLAQAETNADELIFSGKSTTANIRIIPRIIQTVPSKFSLLVIDSAGLADANAVKIGPTGAGTAQTAADVGGLVATVGVAGAGLTAIPGVSNGVVMQTTTIATLTSQTVFTLTAGSADNDAYNDRAVIITDSATAAQKSPGRVIDYVGATKTVTLRSDPKFTIAVGDTVTILGVGDGEVVSTTLGIVTDQPVLTHIDLYFNEVVTRTITTYTNTGGVLTAADPSSWGNLRVVVEAEDKSDLYTVAHGSLTITSTSIGIPFTTMVTGTVSTTVPMKNYEFSVRVAATDEVKLSGVVCVRYKPY